MAVSPENMRLWLASVTQVGLQKWGELVIYDALERKPFETPDLVARDGVI
jgi:hypothetical protein